MKIFNILHVSIDFSTNFLIFVGLYLYGFGGRFEPPTNLYFQRSLNFSLNFNENLDKILKRFQKIAKFH